MPRIISDGERKTIESRHTMDGIFIAEKGDYTYEPVWVDYFDGQLEARTHDRTDTGGRQTTFIFDLTAEERREFPEAGSTVRMRKGVGQKPREV